MTDLHRVLGTQVQAHLFKGAGAPGPGEVVVRHISRTGWLARLFGARLAYRRYQLEHASFAAMLLPHLRRGGFDIVHVIDPPLAAHLAQLRCWFGLPFKLVFTHGGPAPVTLSADVDHVHCLTDEAAAEMRAAGVPAARLTTLPVGIQRERFLPSQDRQTLRARWGVAPDRFVVLCVGAVNRGHKRVDHLIDEAKSVPGDLLLWLDGSLHPDGDIGLLALAHEGLGDRFRYTQVPSDQVGELFRMADLLVSTSVNESFGMAVVEAMSVGVPVAVHDCPHFRALLQGGAHLVDMTRPGALAAFLSAWRQNPAARRTAQAPEQAVSRLAWDRLSPAYLDMYSRLRVSRAAQSLPH